MYSFLREDDINGFQVVRPVTHNGDRPTVHFKHVHFPFGVNKDNSLKMDIMDMDDEGTQKNYRKLYALYEESQNAINGVLDDTSTLSTRHIRIMKDLQKKCYKPSFLGQIEYNQGRMTTVVDTRKGMPPSLTELKHYHASVWLYCDAFWIKDGVIFGGKWKFDRIIL